MSPWVSCKWVRGSVGIAQENVWTVGILQEKCELWRGAEIGILGSICKNWWSSTLQHQGCLKARRNTDGIESAIRANVSVSGDSGFKPLLGWCFNTFSWQIIAHTWSESWQYFCRHRWCVRIKARSLSTASHTYHFFVLGTIGSLPYSYLGICNQVLLHVTLNLIENTSIFPPI